MREFAKKHKHHLRLWAFLLLITAASGWYGYGYGSTRKKAEEKNTPAVTTSVNTSSSTPIQQKKTLPAARTSTSQTSAAAAQKTDVQADETANSEPPHAHSQTAGLWVNGREYTLFADDETSLYEAMRASYLDFSGSDYGGVLGFFVSEINGLKNDTRRGTYWIYYINGQKAQVGISNYIIHEGDTIEWKYEDEE